MQEIENRFFNIKDVIKITGLSRVTIWRLEKKEGFPTRRFIGDKKTGWLREEIEQWIGSRRLGVGVKMDEWKEALDDSLEKEYYYYYALIISLFNEKIPKEYDELVDYLDQEYDQKYKCYLKEMFNDLYEVSLKGVLNRDVAVAYIDYKKSQIKVLEIQAKNE